MRSIISSGIVLVAFSSVALAQAEFYAKAGWGNAALTGGGVVEQQPDPVCIPFYEEPGGITDNEAAAHAGRGSLSADATVQLNSPGIDEWTVADAEMRFDDVVFASTGSQPIVVHWNLEIEGESNDIDSRQVYVLGHVPDYQVWGSLEYGAVGYGGLEGYSGNGSFSFRSAGFQVPVNTPVSLSVKLQVRNKALADYQEKTARYALRFASKGPVFEVPKGVSVHSTEASIQNNKWKGAKILVPQQQGTIQSAIDAAGPGTVIAIAGGTWYESLRIDCTKDLTITAQSGDVVLAGGSSDAAIDVVGSSGITIRDIAIQGGTRAIRVDESPDVTIDGVSIVAFGEEGIRADESDRLEVTDCAITGTPGIGVAVRNTDFVVVSGTEVSGAALGIAVSASNGTSYAPVITSCKLTDGGAGILVAGAPDAVITKNKLKNLGPAERGALHVMSDGATVISNKVKQSGLAFVLIGDDIRAEKNKASKAEIGFWTQGANHVFRKNTAKKIVGVGFIVDANASKLEKNKLDGCGDVGFLVAGDDNFIGANVATKAGTYGFLVTGTGNSFLKNKAKKSAMFDLSDAGSDNAYTSNKFKKVDPDPKD